jgi:uncharacterized damage-inducible protein DinB
MTEIERIEDQLRRAFEGEAWHGPSIREVLADVTARKAAARPLAGAHSIWEIVLHLAAWDNAVRSRLEGEYVENPSEGDWPPVTETSEAAWKRLLEAMENGNRELRKIISRLDDSSLNKVLGEGKPTVYVTLHGTIQHYLYHGGQIALLKKA